MMICAPLRARTHAQTRTRVSPFPLLPPSLSHPQEKNKAIFNFFQLYSSSLGQSWNLLSTSLDELTFGLDYSLQTTLKLITGLCHYLQFQAPESTGNPGTQLVCYVAAGFVGPLVSRSIAIHTKKSRGLHSGESGAVRLKKFSDSQVWVFWLVWQGAEFCCHMYSNAVAAQMNRASLSYSEY